jgi:hypothetical protein
MIRARLYKPTKNAMQSGRAGQGEWVLEYEITTPRRVEPLMGWISADDTLNEVALRFHTREEAVAFAEKNNIDVTIDAPPPRRVTPRSYLDNFKYHPDDANSE